MNEKGKERSKAFHLLNQPLLVLHLCTSALEPWLIGLDSTMYHHPLLSSFFVSMFSISDSDCISCMSSGDVVLMSIGRAARRGQQERAKYRCHTH